MCDIRVYMQTDGTENLVLENVEQVMGMGHETRVINIFGEEKVFNARLTYYSNSERKMVFTPVSGVN